MLPTSVFKGWVDYYEKEPFLADRIESLLVQISFLIASFMGSKAKLDEFFISDRKSKLEKSSMKDEILKCFGI